LRAIARKEGARQARTRYFYRSFPFAPPAYRHSAFRMYFVHASGPSAPPV